MPVGPELPLAARVRIHAERVAVEDGAGPHSYGDLLAASERAAAGLLAALGGGDDLAEARVAFLVPPGFAWPAILLGI